MAARGRRSFWDLLLSDQEFQIMLLIATTIWIYSSILKLPFIVPSNYSDVGYLWIRDVYQNHHNMAIPYVDYKLEYPPIIGLIIWLGQAIGTYAPIVLDSYNTYMVAESVLQFPFAIGTLYNTYILCDRLRINNKRIYLYFLTSLVFIIYGFYNWDFIVAYFVSLSILWFLEKKYDGSSLALSAGVLSKFIPVLMAPAMVISLPNNRARIRFILIAAISWGLVNAPFMMLNFPLWLQTFTHTSGHQLQNTWISMVIQTAGLGDVVSGRDYGHVLSLGVIAYLILRAIFTKHTPLEKILLSWYAWYGAIYLFDPQMFIQLLPIIIITPDFNFIFYRLADLLNAFIILFYFIGGSNPGLPKYLTDQLTPFGLVNTSAALRQLIVLSAYFVAFNKERQESLRNFAHGLLKPVHSATTTLSTNNRKSKNP